MNTTGWARIMTRIDQLSALEAALGYALEPIVVGEQQHHNTHYRGVLADEDDVFVKVIDHHPSYYAAEVQAAHHLAGTGITTPRLVSHGTFGEGSGWLAYSWHDLTSFTPTFRRIEQAGQLLGALHAATRSASDDRLPNYINIHKLIARKITQVAEFDPALADRIRRLHGAIRARANDDLGHDVCLLHGDMGWRNVHLDAEGIVWLFDFEHAAIGHPLLDFAKLWDRELDDPAIRDAFLRGYHHSHSVDILRIDLVDAVRLWAAAGIIPYARPRNDQDFERHAMVILDRLEAALS